MKKKNLKEINEIIGDLTNLETKLAQHFHYEKVANAAEILEWFRDLNKITSRLDCFYKTEMGIK